MTFEDTTQGHRTVMIPPPEGDRVIDVHDLDFFYGKSQALFGVDLPVARNKVTALIGPSGCGKSTLLRTLNRIYDLYPGQSATGEIMFDGENILDQAKNSEGLRARIGMVFQESALFDSMSVEDNVAYRMRQDHVAEDEVKQRVLESLRFVELENTLAKFPSELSGGMRRRVAIARAIVTKPELILYDSPTGGLDPITSTTIIELVIKQRDVWHNTSLMITHRLQDAFMLATHEYDAAAKQLRRIPDNGIDAKTKFLVLNEGKVVFDGTTQELVSTDDAWLKDYIS